jgi:predicted nucleotidyltransferase
MSQVVVNERWLLAERIVGKVLEGYPKAVAAFVGGSFARGDATPTSDIDLVILFASVAHAWRETISVEGTTVELFCHDLNTLQYFLTVVDLPSGNAPLAEMISEGRNMLSDSASAASAQSLSREILGKGPIALTTVQLNMRRYEITTALEDLLDAGRDDECLCIGVMLYEAIADIALRGSGSWSGSGKWLVRRLRRLEPEIASNLDFAMRLLVTDGAAGKLEIQKVVDRVLTPYGGPLLIGHRLDAPPNWRV